MLVESASQAIKNKWHVAGRKNILRQPESAEPHCAVDDPKLVTAMNADGFRMQINCQS